VTSEERVERLARKSPERHVGTLEEVDILEVRFEVMASNVAAPPKNVSHPGSISVLDVVAVMNDISTADGADSRIGREASSNRAKPVGSGHCVVICDGDQRPVRRLASTVQSGHLPRTMHGHDTHSNA